MINLTFTTESSSSKTTKTKKSKPKPIVPDADQLFQIVQQVLAQTQMAQTQRPTDEEEENNSDEDSNGSTSATYHLQDAQDPNYY